MWNDPRRQSPCTPCVGSGVILRMDIAMTARLVCPACRGSGKNRVINRFRFANGERIIHSIHTHHVVEAADTVFNEDWKTAIAHKQTGVSKGTRGVITECVFNFYGLWALVEFEDRDYPIYAAFDKLNHIETLSI